MPRTSKGLVRTGALWALYALLGLFSFVQNMIGPAVPFLRAEFHLDYSVAALHMSAFALGQMACGLMASLWIRRFGIRKVLWGGMLGILVGISGLVLAPSPAFSLASIFFMSYTGTLANASVQASIFQLAGEGSGQALIEANMAASITSAIAPFVLVAGAAMGLGWRALWPAFFLGLGATTICGFRPVNRALPGIGAEGSRGRDAARMPPAFWRLCLLIFVGVGVEWSVGFWATEYLKGLPGHSVSLAAAGAGTFQIAAVCGRFVSSRIVERLGEKRILLGAMALVLLGFPLYWMRAEAITAFAGLALCGFGVATFYPLALSLTLGASNGLTARASSLASFSAGSAIFAMPLFLGLVADRAGLSAALWAIPCGLALMLILLVLGRRKAAR